jgi:hypothetical protein
MIRQAPVLLCAALSGLLVSLVPAAISAQVADTMSGQSRVRVDFVSAERSRFGGARTQSVIGTTGDLRADTLLLTVQPGADPIRVPRSSISGAYLSQGRMSRWEAGLRGAIMPAVLGAALTAVATSIRRRPGDPTPAQSALSSAAWGAATGAALGAWSPEERWHRLTSDQRLLKDREYSAGVSP